MDIYQNFGKCKPEEAHFPPGTIGLPYRIIEAKMWGQGKMGDALAITVERPGGGEEATYGLVGETLFRAFMTEAGVDSIDALVEKEVLVFFPPSPPHERRVIGLAVKH